MHYIKQKWQQKLSFIILQKISILSYIKKKKKLLKFSIDIAGIHYIWKYIKTEKQKTFEM